MRQKWLRHLCILAVLTMLAAACGGDDAGDPGAEEEVTEDTEATEEDTEATEDDEETVEATGPGDGTLFLGSLLPETGNLAFLGPPEFAGVELAVNDINEAGGVLGNDVELSQGDSGDTSTDIANQTVDRLLAEGADAIIGAASSGVSFTVIDKITQAGVIMFSPANTAPNFTTYDDNGLYFRVAPSDVMQGQVLAEVIVEEGNARVGLMALQDPYGEGLLNFTVENLEASGVEISNEIIYDPQAQNFDAEIQQLVSEDPDAIVVIGFDESARLISGLIEQGLGPADKNVYGVDGNMGNALGEQFDDEGALEGMRGTTPLTDLSADFQERLLELDPDLADFNYAGESYDAAVIIALAATIADSDDPADFAAEIPGVTRDGTECSSFAECLELVEAGEDIDYQGIVGPIELSDVGDPTVASFAILEFQADNTLGDDPEFRVVTLEE
ncbi:MAG: ABC transporter substrate-binding protein [Nitriliruptorales bacterium]|nr:ABC transporter substrate-binding protein [Nitriliruptorales bacterium]